MMDPDERYTAEQLLQHEYFDEEFIEQFQQDFIYMKDRDKEQAAEACEIEYSARSSVNADLIYELEKGESKHLDKEPGLEYGAQNQTTDSRKNYMGNEYLFDFSITEEVKEEGSDRSLTSGNSS